MLRLLHLCILILLLSLLLSCWSQTEDKPVDTTTTVSETITSETTANGSSTEETEPTKTAAKLFYIYKYNPLKEEYYMREDLLDPDNSGTHTFAGTYECETADAKVISSTRYYFIMKDGGYILYNLKTKEKQPLFIISQDFNYLYAIYDDLYEKLMGFVINTDDVITIFKMDGSNIAIGEEYNNVDRVSYGGLIISRYGMRPDTFRSCVINLSDGSTTKIDDVYLQRVVNNGAVYYMGFASDFNEIWFKPYNNDLKCLSNNWVTYGDVTNDGNMLLVGDYKEINYDDKLTKFRVINSDGNVIFTSRDYNNILFAANEYVCVDDSGMLKLVDKSDNIKAVFCEWNENMAMHTMLSGYKGAMKIKKEGYTENIYKLTQKDGQPVYERFNFPADIPAAVYIICENNSIAYGTEGRGIEYYYVPETGEAGKITLTDIGGYAKPVLYLYPQEECEVSVAFEHPEYLTVTYPVYPDSGWQMNVSPDGTLTGSDGRGYYALYWEESGYVPADFSTGFCVTAGEAAEFLEDTLDRLGFTQREANEFIIYWLPLLQKNGVSLVHFELTESRQAYNKLNITPIPDSMLRVAMHIKKIDALASVTPQSLPRFERSDFAAVEWGGVVE